LPQFSFLAGLIEEFLDPRADGESQLPERVQKGEKSSSEPKFQRPDME
jgi:hypothetical protein